jgi:hypothetical protein
MVLQTVHEEFTTICINVLDVFEASMNCKGASIFSGINCHQGGPASCFDARDGQNREEIEPSPSSSLSHQQYDVVLRDDVIREQASPDGDDVFVDGHENSFVYNDNNNKENEDLMDLSISSYLHPSVRTSSSAHQQQQQQSKPAIHHRRHHRRHDSSMSAASTVSTAMFFPSDDDIFRSRMNVTEETDDHESGTATDMKLQRCVAWSQDSTCDNVYPCYPANSSSSITNNSIIIRNRLPLVATATTSGSSSSPLLASITGYQHDDANTDEQYHPLKQPAATTSTSTETTYTAKSPDCVRMVHWDELVVGQATAENPMTIP